MQPFGLLMCYNIEGYPRQALPAGTKGGNKVKKVLGICGFLLAIVLMLSAPMKTQYDSKSEVSGSAAEVSRPTSEIVSDTHTTSSSVDKKLKEDITDDDIILVESSQDIALVDSVVSDDFVEIGEELGAWEEIANIVADTGVYYKGGLYTDNYTKLVMWPELSDEEIEQYDIERRSYTNECFMDDIYLCEENFHSNLKVIGAEAFRGNTQAVLVVLPWGVEEIHARAFQGCDMMVYIPDTVAHISSDNDATATIGTRIKYVYSPFNKEAFSALGYNSKEIYEEAEQWYDMYQIDSPGWLPKQERVYYFAQEPNPHFKDRMQLKMLTGTQVINGITYHFAETGELLSAELPEGDYKLDGVEIHVDEQGSVTIKQ